MLAVRASPISKTASILIILIGAFVLFTGIVAGALANDVAGVAFIALGLALYWLLLRFTKKLQTEFSGSAG
jgi:membrane protein implicated in regulation of membrane protease activity